jgi:type II secretion system protein H
MASLRTRTGFTLIEIAIVLAVMAILSAAAFWRMGPGIQRAKVNRSASTLAADLQYAQMIAARQRRPVVLITSEAVKSYMIRDATTATIYRERYLGQDTDFGLDSLLATPTAVEIFPNGVVRNTATFVVALSEHSRNVRITRAGQIRITQGS